MVTVRERDPNQRAEQAVRAVLPRTAKICRGRTEAEADLIVNGQLFEIKWIGDGRLADAKRLLAKRQTRYGVAVARRMSSGARVALTEAGIGWVDETGAAEIVIGSIVVSRTGQSPKPAQRLGRWTPSVFAVAEALLCSTKATVAATEVATGLSNGSCTTALRVLTDLGLLETDVGRGRNSARHVVDKDQLLDAYAAAVESMPACINLHLGVTWRDPVDGLLIIGQKWDKAEVAWASTGAIAAAVIAPYLTTVNSADVYVDADTVLGLEATARVADLRPIEGGRLILRPFPTVTVQRLATVVDELRVAPWPRVYADLRTVGVRGEDAAEHLREVVRGQ